MLTRFLVLCSVALLSTMAPLPGAAQGAPTQAAWGQGGQTQAASVSDVRVTISLSRAVMHNALMIIATFTTDTPDSADVYCLSGYRDLQYVLRNAAGNVIPVNPDAWKFPDQVNYWGAGPCEAVKIPRKESRVLIPELYPNLSPGTYTLQVTLAPRGRAGRAPFRPIQIEVH